MKQGPLTGRCAIVTGASAGIGEATAEVLAGLGAKLVLAARRLERLEALAERIRAAGGEAHALALDVSSAQSCSSFVTNVLESHGPPHILVNNAGLARGFAPVAESDEQDWREMMEANVMGLMRLTRLFLPGMIEHQRGDLVHVSSVAGLQPYPRGAAYCASKAAVEAFAVALRRELLGTSIRQLVLQPGMVETEFSQVRFHGDAERAAQVYAGVQPLTARDVADCIGFAVTRPAHVSLQTLLLMPTAQATATEVLRTST